MSEVMDHGVIGMPFDMAMGDEVSRRQFYSRAQAVLAKRDELRAALSVVTAERDSLRDQVKALQSDANSWQSGYNKGRHDGSKHRQSEVQQLRQELKALRGLVAECTEYLNTDRETCISSGSILHRKLIAVMAGQGGSGDE